MPDSLSHLGVETRVTYSLHEKSPGLRKQCLLGKALAAMTPRHSSGAQGKALAAHVDSSSLADKLQKLQSLELRPASTTPPKDAPSIRPQGKELSPLPQS